MSTSSGTPQGTGSEAGPSRSKLAAGRDNARMVAAGVIGALIAAFALLNFDEVRVHWLITTGKTPLIVVILVSFVLGLAVDRLLALRASRKHKGS